MYWQKNCCLRQYSRCGKSGLRRHFLFFTDNSPIREVTAARLAGLGFVGNNGLLISPAYGTYHFIAEIVTDLWLEPSMPMESGCEACGGAWMLVRQVRCPRREWTKADAARTSPRKKGN